MSNPSDPRSSMIYNKGEEKDKHQIDIDPDLKMCTSRLFQESEAICNQKTEGKKERKVPCDVFLNSLPGPELGMLQTNVAGALLRANCHQRVILYPGVFGTNGVQDLGVLVQQGFTKLLILCCLHIFYNFPFWLLLLLLDRFTATRV